MVATLDSRFSFGAQLRALRIQAGLSLDGLAARIHYSKSHLSKVENGIKLPTVQMARQCDTALGCDGKLASLVDQRSGPRSSRTKPANTFAHGRGNSIDPMTLVDAPVFMPDYSPKWTDPYLVDRFRGVFNGLRSLGQTVRPRDVLPELMSHARTLTNMARNADSAIRDDLFRLAARFTEHAGWMAQELGRNDWASLWTQRATDLARQGGEDMTAYQLVRLGDLSMYDGDAAQTIQYATLALDATGDARVRGIAAQRLAHGHALANDQDACLRALDLAGELLDREMAADERAPVLGSSTVADHRAMAFGWCLYDLCRYEQAADVLSVEVARLPPHAHRARARYGMRLARSYADMGDPELACATAEPILGLLPFLDSATIQRDVSGLALSLGRRRQHSAVKRLLPFVAQARANFAASFAAKGQPGLGIN